LQGATDLEKDCMDSGGRVSGTVANTAVFGGLPIHTSVLPKG